MEKSTKYLKKFLNKHRKVIMRFKMNRRNNVEFINIDALKNTKIIDKLTKAVIYSPEDYGISAKYTGEGTKVLVIDSGAPKHKDIEVIEEPQDFASNEDNVDAIDRVGHGTIVAGLLGAKNKKSIIGLAPDATIFYAKATNSKNNSNYNSIVSAILWGIVKDVDIIVMALGSQYDYKILHDSIKKAHDFGICIFAAAGNHINEEGSEINYPARYPEVYSVGNLTRAKKTNDKILEKVDVAMKNKAITSTYLKNRYIKVSGSSISTAIVAGLASLLIEKNKKIDKKDMPKTIYSELQKIVK